jgi:hypothetical protein
MGIFAISLIDKELKVYKIKQHGTRLQFLELYNFKTKHTVSCLHIDRYATDRRAILCIGTHKGEIFVYYLDEPADPADDIVMPGMFV